MLKSWILLPLLWAGVGSVAHAGGTQNYSYDALGRLVRVDHTGTINNGLQTRYSHDKGDNRTNVTVVGAGRSGPAAGGTYIGTAKNLFPGESIISDDGRFRLVAQADGNLVIYMTGSGAIWASGTGGRSMRLTAMQDDGNLVIYDASGTAIWVASTGVTGARLYMQSDGNAVIYGPGGNPLWDTKTGGR